LNDIRKRFISMGFGIPVAEISRISRQYKQMQKMMRSVQGKCLRRALAAGRGFRVGWLCRQSGSVAAQATSRGA